MKKVLKVLLTVLVILILVIASGIFYMTRGLSSGKEVSVNKIDVSKLSDGVYHGQYKEGRWTNELDVTVKNHKITDINVTKDVKFNLSDVTKNITKEVIGKQNTDVDIVTGATVTSKAYLKSIENALSK
ncbi:FMN-binding protein [Clostridium paridis]|uniref:FMN-binding protein n=1 Tax=Clostridium paridis TaxID=2803863 RepID=A0A937K6M9_9CLOT|nr:FMN-binding protein [Clostridium paridis]MBL4934095.1 FMN-binding protein [Clostridium paridis]